MCGIVGYIGKKQATPILMEGLSKLEYRGYDSAGVAVHHGDSIKMVKAQGKLVNLAKRLEETPLSGTLGIGHTRWATHGAPSDINSHPHMSEDKMIAVVHNGIIENYLEIKEELEAKGYQFHSETDTETVALLLDYYYKRGNDFLESVFAVLERIEGAYALAILCKDDPDTLIAARKNCPLVIGQGEGENFIAANPAMVLFHDYFWVVPLIALGIVAFGMAAGGLLTRFGRVGFWIVWVIFMFFSLGMPQVAEVKSGPLYVAHEAVLAATVGFGPAHWAAVIVALALIVIGAAWAMLRRACVK